MPPKKAVSKIEQPYNEFSEYTLHEPRLFALPASDNSAIGDAGRALVDQLNGHREVLRFAVTDGKDDDCGRRVVAARDLSVGDVVQMEECPLWSVLTDCVREACSGCGSALKGMKAETQDGLFYCSSECLRSFSSLVALEQLLQRCYADIDAKEVVDGNMLRLAVRYALLKHLQGGRRALTVADGLKLSAPVSDVGHMVEHSMGADPGFVSALADVANQVWPHLPSAIKADYANSEAFAKEFAGSCARFNANCHGLIHNDSRAQQFAIGLFPISALFNHSCLPNCLFQNEGSALRIVAVRPIKTGEELLVNYVALIHSRNSRRLELIHEKGFLCKCERCSLCPTTQEAFNLLKMEVLLQGVRVQPLTETQAAKANLTSVVAALCAPAKQSNEFGIPEASLNDLIPGGVYIPLQNQDETERQIASLSISNASTKDALEAELMKKQYVSSADTSKVINGAALAKLEYPARAAVERAIEIYTTNGISIQQRLLAAEKAFKVCVCTLAPGHELFLTLCPLLANLFKATGDNKRHFELLLDIAFLAEHCFSPAMLPLVNYYEATLAACTSFEKEITNSIGTKAVLLKKTFAQKIKDTRKEHTQKILRVLEVCYGTNHSRYKDVAEKTNIAL